MDSDFLKQKASELWELIIRLETEKYDLEERQRRQDYDVSSRGGVFILYGGPESNATDLRILKFSFGNFILYRIILLILISDQRN